MSNIVIGNSEGLSTQANDLAATAGSTSVADNVVFTREGRPERRNGFKDYSTNLPDFEPAQLIASESGDQAYLHLDSGLWYHNGTKWVRKQGGTYGNVYGMSFDGTSKLYIADAVSYTISSFDVTNGKLRLIAGTPGSSGDTDGTGAAARFTAPYDCWYDGSTYLYVADRAAIRRVTVATGVVTTVCGAVLTTGDSNLAGTLARFGLIRGIIGDGSNLYVNDLRTNGKIKKVPISTFTPSTLATPGVYTGDSKIAYDGSFVYYKSSDTILQKCDKTSGATSTFLTVAAGKAFDLHYSSSYIYYSTTVSLTAEVRRAAVSNAADSFVTALQSTFLSPGAISVDSSGHVFFANPAPSLPVLYRCYSGAAEFNGALLLSGIAGSILANTTGIAPCVIGGPD